MADKFWVRCGLLVCGVLLAATAPEAIGRVFNVGNVIDHSLAEIAAAIKPKFRMRVVGRYELPESLGTRTMVETIAVP